MNSIHYFIIERQEFYTHKIFMAFRKIKRVSNFTEQEKTKLEKANIITLSDFISTPFDNLRIILDIGYYSLQKLIFEISEIIAPKPNTV